MPSEKARPQYTADINVGPLYTPSFNDRLSYGSFATASHGQGDTHPYGTSASASYHGATSNPYAQDPLENPILGSNRYTPVRKDNWYGPSGSAPKLSPLESQVADALADLGYFFPRFVVDVVPNARRKTAELAITIFNEGPRAVIGEIDTSGNKINSREEIVNYLKVHPGDPYNRKTLFEMKQRLLDSGRFFDVDIKPLATSYSPRLMWIDVKELNKAPPLSKPLLPEEEMLLKFGKWLGDIDRWQGDMVLRNRRLAGNIDDHCVAPPRHSGDRQPEVAEAARAPARLRMYRNPRRNRRFLRRAAARSMLGTCNPSSNWLLILDWA